MSDFDPRKDEDRAYLAGALTAYALGLKPEEVLSGGRVAVFVRGYGVEGLRSRMVLPKLNYLLE